MALGLQQRAKGWQSLENVQAIWFLGSSFFDGNFRITPLLSLIAKEMVAKAKPDRAIVKAYPVSVAFIANIQ